MRNRWVFVRGVVRALLVLLVLASGCGSCDDDDADEADERDGRPTTTATVVTGQVKLAEGHALPGYAQADMERRVLAHAERGAWPQSCTPPKLADAHPVKLTADGFLSGVMVAATGFRSATPRPPKVHDVVIEDCRLTPRLVVAIKGDVLRIRNKVDFPFMPTFGPTTIARTLIPGQKFEMNLDRGGVEAVLCTFTAPCGRADVVTIYHPVYAITDAQGRFRIEDFPPDQPVELNAWHPLFESSEVSLTVQLGETKEVTLELAPKARFVPDAGVDKEAPEPPEKPVGARPGTSVGTSLGAD